MDKLTFLYFNLVFLSGILAFLVAGILVFYNRTEGLGSKLLAGFLTCFALLALNYALMTTGFFLSYPHFWRVAGFASFSFAPLAYLYVRTTLAQSYRLRKWDFLYFVPAVLHPLSLIPFFLKPADAKVAFLRKVVEDPKLITLETESLLPDGFSFALRVGIGIAATVGQFVMLYRWKKKHEMRMLAEKQNQELYRWLFRFSIVMAVFWLSVIAQVLYNHGFSSNLNKTLIFSISGTILFVSVYLLLLPSVLYGFRGWKYEPVTAETIEPVNTVEGESPKKYSLSAEQGVKLKLALEKYFKETAAFRKQGYALGDLASELGFPAYQLSAFINQEYAKNFNELINQYRVEYLIEKSKTSKDFSQYTLEALGNDAGFNSRAAFIAAVKKTTGRTPSEVFGRRAAQA